MSGATAKNTTRTAAKSVKIAERTSKTAIKTSQQTVNAATRETIAAVKAIIAGRKALIAAIVAGGNQAIAEVALTQVGNQCGQNYWSWYGFDSRVEWCACFVSWCADQCGYIESGLIPKFAGCVDGANWFKSNGKWQDRIYEPKTGDIIFFEWEGDGTTDHVGIVEKCENGTVYTVEGNSGDACKQRQYKVGSNSIYGYGIPAY